jgi:4-hydroxy-3-polyprenylbenzoate decarboxylase
MPFDTLQDFIRTLDKRGELKRISYPLSPRLEMTEVADRVVKAGGPALLFENPEGCKMPVAMNLFGTMGRMAAALGVEDLQEVADRIEDLLHMRPPGTLIEKVRSLPRVAALTAVGPRTVRKGVCKEVVETRRPSFAELPVLTCWPGDGGPYVTLGMIFTYDPATRRRNVGIYRVQIFDERTAGMHWQIHKVAPRHYRDWQAQKRRMPVAIVLGGDPALIYAASAPLPEDMDEMVFAGFLRGDGVEMVRCETIDMEVPAGAEIVLEGYIDPDEVRLEGPFGEHTGFYSLPAPFPVFHLTCVTRRNRPIYPATVVGVPIMEDYFLGKATERIFLPLLRLQLPELVDICFPPEGIFHNLVFASIRKRYPGHARKLMHAMWGLGQLMFSKVIVVVDEQVNIHNTSEVLFALGNNIDPERDAEIVRGPVDSLNFASPLPNYGSKMGIDATRKWKGEGFERDWPEPIRMSAEVKQKIDGIWRRLGLA